MRNINNSIQSSAELTAFVFSPKPPTSVGGYHQLGFA